MADGEGGSTGGAVVWKGTEMVEISEYSFQKTDAVVSSTMYWRGKPDEAKAKFDELKTTTEWYNVTMSLGLDGTATLSATKHESNSLGVGVVSGANTSISLVAVPLIQHPRYSKLLTEDAKIQIGDDTTDTIPIQKAIQEYIHIDPYRNKERMKNLATAINNKDGVYFEYCKRITSGQTDYLQPQAVFSVRVWTKDLQLSNPVYDIVGNAQPGEVNTPPDTTY